MTIRAMLDDRSSPQQNILQSIGVSIISVRASGLALREMISNGNWRFLVSVRNRHLRIGWKLRVCKTIGCLLNNSRACAPVVWASAASV